MQLQSSTFGAALDRRSASNSPMGLLGGLLKKVSHALSVRRDIKHLSELDDHLLRDIGINRADILDAAFFGRRTARALVADEPRSASFNADFARGS